MLIGCDKLDAALYGELPPRAEGLNPEVLERFRQGRFASGAGPLSTLREIVYRGVGFCLTQCPEARVYTLTAPTGSGKTLALLRAGLILRERAVRRGGEPPRLLYCLPFTSIIDQNFDVFRDVLACGGQPPLPQTLLRHHHLSDFSYATEDRQYDEDSAELLVETWNSEIAETEFLNLTQQYFDRMRRRTAGSELELELARLAVGTVGREFRLFEEDGNSQGFFVVRDDEDRAVWDAFQQLSEERDRAKRRSRFRALRESFYSRLINVRLPGRQAAEGRLLPLYPEPGPHGSYDSQVGFTSSEVGT